MNLCRRPSTVLAFAILLFARGRVEAADPVADPQSKILHKVIITETTEVFADPSDPTTKGAEPLGPFSIRYLLQVTDDDVDGTKKVRSAQPHQLRVGNDEFVKIGGTPNTELGWVNVKHVLFWKTRSALSPIGVPGRSLVVCKDQQLTEPIAESERAFEGDFVTLAMILEPPAAVSGGTPTYNVVLYKQSTSETPEAPAATTTEQADRNAVKNTLGEVVFVIDTTASMTPLLEDTKDIVRRVATELAGGANREAKARLRFGLVQYQDSTPGLRPSDVTVPLCEVDKFVQRVAPIQVGNVSSEEWQEDVIAGLVAAMDFSSSGSTSKVGWSADSTKHIILLGDASHLPPQVPPELQGMIKPSVAGKTLSEVVRAASSVQGETAGRLNYNLYAVYAKNQDGAGDWIEGQNDFSLVGSNDGKSNSSFWAIDVNDKAERTTAVDGLVALIKEVGAYTADPAALREAVAQGRSLTQGALSVWKLLPAADPQKEVEPGWARPTDKDDRNVAEEVLFVRKIELQRLKSKFVGLCEELDYMAKNPAERKNVDELLVTLQSALAATQAGEKFVAGTALRDLIQDLPLRSDAFNVSAEQIALWEDSEFMDWFEKIQEARDRYQELVEGAGADQNWITLDAEQDERIRFLQLKDLP